MKAKTVGIRKGFLQTLLKCGKRQSNDVKQILQENQKFEPNSKNKIDLSTKLKKMSSPQIEESHDQKYVAF